MKCNCLVSFSEKLNRSRATFKIKQIDLIFCVSNFSVEILNFLSTFSTLCIPSEANTR